MICIHHQLVTGWSVQKNVMAGYVAVMAVKTDIEAFGGGKVTESVHLGNLGMMGKIILTYVSKK